MDIIFPETKLNIIANVGLTAAHKDTYYFATPAMQTSFFLGKTVYSLDEFTPVRVGQGVRVGLNANQLYNCSYIMFQNSNYGNKWFYAFITEIEWVNNQVSIIHYQMDNLQTWWFEFRFQRSFVEREHVADDTIGANLVPENVEMGDYIINDTSRTGYFEDYSFVVFATVEKSGASAIGGLYSGIYSGLYANVFSDADDVNDFLTTITTQNKSTAVVSIVMIPTIFVQGKGTESEFHAFSVPKNQESLDGYVPRNNKLFTSPFNVLVCTNLEGTAAEYKYEYFKDPDSCNFKVYEDMSANPTAFLVPMGYNTVGVTDENWNEKLGMGGFPQCGWNTDTFKAWVAQNGSSTAISTLGTALGFVGNMATGNIGGMIGSTLSIASTVAQVKATASQPPQAHGPTSSNALVASRQKDFWFYAMTIRKEFAQIIDGYFDMFGYAVHKLKIPNFFSRPSWNYIKTQESNVTGNAPQFAIDEMKSILDGGITFWHGDWIGDYSRDNKV